MCHGGADVTCQQDPLQCPPMSLPRLLCLCPRGPCPFQCPLSPCTQGWWEHCTEATLGSEKHRKVQLKACVLTAIKGWKGKQYEGAINPFRQTTLDPDSDCWLLFYYWTT